MSAALLSVGVAVFWGIGASWDGWVAKRIDPWVGVSWRLVYGIVATVLFTLFGVSWWELSQTAWLWLFAAGVFLAGGWFCYLHALRRDHSELSVALSSTYVLPAVAILFLLGQPIGWPVFLACALVASGSVMAKVSATGGVLMGWAGLLGLVWCGAFGRLLPGRLRSRLQLLT